MIKSIVLFSRNIDKSSSFYISVFGFKIHKNSKNLSELKDKNNISLIIKKTNNESFLSTGYSPIINFKVDDIDFIKDRISQEKISLDGDIEIINNKKILSFRSPDNIMISCIEDNNSTEEEINNDNIPLNDEISNILKKIKY